MVAKSSTNGSGGRDSRGRFTKGNPGGPGNPYGKRVAQIRSMILDTVSDKDLRSVVKSLVDKAKNGDVVAARELLNRMVGKAGVLPEAEPEREGKTGFNMSDVIRGCTGTRPGKRARGLDLPGPAEK